MEISCIYKITSKTNGKFYIGSASYWKRRKQGHISDLLKNKHHSSKLQNHVNKYGIDDLEFEILEEVERIKEKLLEREQFYIDTLKPFFNILKIAGSSMGNKASDETILRQSLAKKGKKQIPEAIEARRISNTGKKRKPKPEGWINPNLGSKRTPEQIKTISEAHKGQPSPTKGIPKTEEQKRHQSEIMKGRKKEKPMSDEQRKMISDRMMGNKNFLGRKHTEESKKKMSEKMQLRLNGIK